MLPAGIPQEAMTLRLEIIPEKAIVVLREKTVMAASWFGPSVIRPYIHPFLGPGDIELTRIGHPRDPVAHSHHRSIWIGHHDVSGSNFWEESPGAGRIEQVGAELAVKEGAEVKAVLECIWKAADARQVLFEKRALVFSEAPAGGLTLEIDTELRPASREARVTFGDTPFGLLGIRVARTMAVTEGLGGEVLNSNEAENEAGCHWQHADWCDYSGPVPLSGPFKGPGSLETNRQAAEGIPVVPSVIAGIACFNHPGNSTADTIWHVRDDGWMGPCLSKGAPRELSAGGALRIRYRIETHAGRPGQAGIGESYRRWRREKAE
jgi:methane monooxygenase PmoA-like